MIDVLRRDFCEDVGHRRIVCADTKWQSVIPVVTVHTGRCGRWYEVGVLWSGWLCPWCEQVCLEWIRVRWSKGGVHV